MIDPIIEFMKFSPTALIISVVILLLLLAILVLAFFLGNQYAIFKLTKSSPLEQSINETGTTTEILSVTPPAITLPSLSTTEDNGLDRWLRGTVLRATPLQFGEQFTLAINSSDTNRGAVASNNEVYVYFTDVVYDSRCPEEVDCFAAGEAIVKVEVRGLNTETETVYLGSATGGKPNAWTYHGLQDESMMTPEVKAEIARGQERIANTTYVTGATYKDGAAIVNGYRVSLRNLTPARHRNDANTYTTVIEKEDYRATFVVTPAEQ